MVGRIVASENASLDGVVQDPTGDEGFRHGGWFAQIADRDREAWARAVLDEARTAEALLLGRRSYEFFDTRWPARTGPFAHRLNSMAKYVISSTLDVPGWTNSIVLDGDVASEVTKLKQDPDGDVIVYASFRLLHLLIEHDLLDELRLTIFPFPLGNGRRLLNEANHKTPLHLIHAEAIGEDLMSLRYKPERRT